MPNTLALSFDLGTLPVATALDALCLSHGWIDIPTSGTKANFAKQVVGDFVKRTIDDYQRQQASQAAINAVTPAVIT